MALDSEVSAYAQTINEIVGEYHPDRLQRVGGDGPHYLKLTVKDAATRTRFCRALEHFGLYPVTEGVSLRLGAEDIPDPLKRDSALPPQAAFISMPTESETIVINKTGLETLGNWGMLTSWPVYSTSAEFNTGTHILDFGGRELTSQKLRELANEIGAQHIKIDDAMLSVSKRFANRSLPSQARVGTQLRIPPANPIEGYQWDQLQEIYALGTAISKLRTASDLQPEFAKAPVPVAQR